MPKTRDRGLTALADYDGYSINMARRDGDRVIHDDGLVAVLVLPAALFEYLECPTPSCLRRDC